MPSFAYSGRSASGPIQGELDGASAGAVADLLLSRGITPLSIDRRETNDRASPASAAAGAAPWSRGRVRPVELMLFARQLHTLLRSAVPILRALAGLQESATSVVMRDTLAAVRRSLESGIELSMSLAQHPRVFGAFFVSMVRVGELTGRLDEVFLRLFKHLEFEGFMAQQVRSALRYPTFVVASLVGAMGVINLMVVPAFAQVFKQFGAELPWATRVLVACSEFTLAWGWVLGLGAVGAWLGIRQWLGTATGRLAWDGLLLKLPLAGKIVRKATLARLARSFSLALKSGVPIEQALTVAAATVDNAFIARKVEGMRESVERGESILRAAAASGVFTPVVLQMIAVGEETGSVDELMDEVAELYSSDVQYELKTLSSQIEPILVVFLGALVLLLALGVFLPVWDLGRTAFKK